MRHERRCRDLKDLHGGGDGGGGGSVKLAGKDYVGKPPLERSWAKVWIGSSVRFFSWCCTFCVVAKENNDVARVKKS